MKRRKRVCFIFITKSKNPLSLAYGFFYCIIIYMKNTKHIWIGLAIIIFGVALSFINKQEVIEEVKEVKNEEQVLNTRELCFVQFGEKQESGFYDKFILRMSLDNTNKTVKGYLKLLPAEKDSAIGSYEGTVSDMDPKTSSRTIDAWWNREGEGLTEKSQLRIIFGEGNASIGFGAMKANADGSYSYEDLSKVDYSLTLSDYSCEDLSEREAVEEILWKNINTLSPVKAVLGGSFYVVSMDLDLVKNSGSVVYEDGHVQEKREFNYEVLENKVVNLKIK
jgi:hypothetical protein